MTKIKRIIIFVILSFIPLLLFAENNDKIQFLKEKRIQWRNEQFVDKLIETSKLETNDDFIFLEEYNTDFSCGLILLKSGVFYYFDGGEIRQKKLKNAVVKELSKMSLHDTIENNIGARDKSYYNVFISNGETINYSLFDDSIKNNIDDETIEKDRQTIVRILDLLGLEIYGW